MSTSSVLGGEERSRGPFGEITEGGGGANGKPFFLNFLFGYPLGVSVSVVDLLQEQHKRVGELFDLVSSPDEDRPARLRELMRELSAHITAERRLAGGNDHPDLADGYKRMEELMILIERRKSNSPDVPAMVTDLMDAVEAHARESEEKLFPDLAALPAQEQQELVDRLRGEEAELDSHPHPHLNSTKLASATIGKAVYAWDTLRDRTVNPQHPEQAPGDT